MQPRILLGLILALGAVSAEAALHGRLPATPGGTDYRAWYDDVLLITWLADANAAQTSGFDPDGRLPWASAQAWIISLNFAQHLGVQDWRLAKITDTGMRGCSFSYDGTDCGYNVNASLNEMAGLYTTLGNLAAFTTAGVQRACATAAPNYCLSSAGPFADLQPAEYWSGTENQDNQSQAWGFHFGSGLQQNYAKTSEFYAWAVRNGDIDADQDGVVQPDDNCTLTANPGQPDTDGDGYGNLCDADLNQSGLTTATDFTLLRSCLNLPASTSVLCASADMNGSGLVTTADFTLLRARLNTQPGPSAVCVHGASGSCPWQAGDMHTFIQDDYGDSSSSAGPVVGLNFNSVYGGAGLTIGGTYVLVFTNGNAVFIYLPAGGPAGALTGSLIDPITSSSGELGGQVLALQLNVDFSATNALQSAVPLGSLYFCNFTAVPQLNGQTVGEFLTSANSALGGGGFFGISASTMAAVAAAVSEAFRAGTPSSFAQSTLRVGACVN